MPTIIKRGSRYRVQIRRKGHPTQSETFASKADAKAWAKRIEGQMDAKAGNHQPAIPTEPEPAKVSMTLGEALKLYLGDITPTKKGSKQETNRITAWLRDPLASHPCQTFAGPSSPNGETRGLQKGKPLQPSARPLP